MITIKQVKRFDFQLPPRNPNKFFNFLTQIISKSKLRVRHCKIEKIGMKNVKPPYILLSNHASLVDFAVARRVSYPYRLNNVSSLENFHDYPEFLFRRLGVIGKRKFTKDISLIRNIKYSLQKLGNIFCIYPEARYSLDGTTSFIPESLGKLLKLFKVPVAILIMKGNFVGMPQWNKKDKKTKVEATVKLVFTKEQIEKLSVEEINKIIHDEFIYDDFKWQKENNIIIDDKGRADGLHSILYQCPHCGKEFEMDSKGTELWCNSCGKRWTMTELGELKAKEGETEFSHIPDWFKWERENVRKEVRNGTYHVEDDVRVETLPNPKKFLKQGTGHFVQDKDGIKITGVAYGKPFEVIKEPLEQESVHIEYDYKGRGDGMEVAVPDESYWVYPINKRDIISKISIATEELYFLKKEQVKDK